jgi:hypothetical protein
MHTVLDLRKTSYQGHPFRAEGVPTVVSVSGCDWELDASAPPQEVVEVDRIAANPINRVDPSGLLALPLVNTGGPFSNLAHYSLNWLAEVLTGGLATIPFQHYGTSDQEFGQGSYLANLVQDDLTFQLRQKTDIAVPIKLEMVNWAEKNPKANSIPWFDSGGWSDGIASSGSGPAPGHSSFGYDMIGQATLGQYALKWNGNGGATKEELTHRGTYVRIKFSGDIVFTIDDSFNVTRYDPAQFRRHIDFEQHLQINISARRDCASGKLVKISASIEWDRP